MPPPGEDQAPFSIEVLAKQTGGNIETIRNYERVGVMTVPTRSAGGYRQYDRGHGRRLRFVKRARELGFSLDEIRALLTLVDGGYTCAEVRELTLLHLRDVTAKIADLTRMERTLRETADRCAGDEAPECPIVEVLSDDAAMSIAP